MVTIESILITDTYVREALDGIIHTALDERSNPLEQLQLVDIQMSRADFTFFRNQRRYALYDILVSTIGTQYSNRRALLNLPHIRSPFSLELALNTIVEDARTGNSDLIGWSWLYFHYVESDLGISQSRFCDASNIEARTVRRYQNRSIKQLAANLVREEQVVRRNRRKIQLLQKLPHQGNIPILLERENLLNKIHENEFSHYLIVGPRGIGKTVFVEASLMQRIEANEVDHVIWLDCPQSIDNIRLFLAEQLLKSDSKLSLADYISLKSIVIVLDDIEELTTDLSQLENFLLEFSNLYIYIISRAFFPIAGCLQIRLTELALYSVQQMIRSSVLSMEAVGNGQSILQLVGGNPLAIDLIIKNQMFFDLRLATSLTLDQLFSELFTTLAPSVKLAWLILSLIRDTQITRIELSELDNQLVGFEDFVTLGRIGVMESSEPNSSVMSLTVSASQYIRSCYQNSLDLQVLVYRLVGHIKSTLDHSARFILALVESLLLFDWLSIKQEDNWECTYRFWKAGLRNGHYAKWYAILGKFTAELTSDNIDLALGLGICCNYLGKWDYSSLIFSTIAKFAGIHGLFSYQLEALCELAKLMRQQGNYGDAIATLDYIDSVTSTTIYPDISKKAMIERVEITLETGNVLEAKRLLTYVTDNMQRLIIQLEINIREPNDSILLPFVSSIGDTLQFIFNYIPSKQARVHILLGRLYQRTQNYEVAIRHLSIALSLLVDLDNDPFAIARTQANLAAALITSITSKQVYELLESAERIQRTIGDRVGLAVTLHNRNALLRKIVN